MFYSILFGNSNIFLYLCLFFARVGETLLPERKSKSLAAYITIQLQRKMEIITIIYNTMKHKYPRLLSVLCALMIATSASWAVPAYRGWQTRTQPDGTTITIRQVGDEFYHYWETEDGKVAVEQPDGTFVVNNEQAPTGEQVVARRIAARNAKQPRRAVQGVA